MIRYFTILLLFISATFAIGQISLSKHELKGKWIVPNLDSSFYKSDTLVFMKCINIDKAAPLHHYGRGFIENTFAIQNYTNFFEFKLKAASVVKISNIVNDKTDTTHTYMFHDGSWEMNGRLLKIRSRDFRLNYGFISSEKGKFTVNGKEYTTVFLRFRRLLK
ncbi:MAG: hypothetical protein K1X81_11855 [Bacteroidia bacterium]|nr:hypothetical protein [Bacteroidia bacterium]